MTDIGSCFRMLPTSLWRTLCAPRVAASAGPKLERPRPATAPDQYTVQPQESDDYRTLLDTLEEPPSHIVWLWSYGVAPDWLAEDQCYALHALLQALEGMASPLQLTIVASGVAAVSDKERAALALERAPLPGFVTTATQEFPALVDASDRSCGRFPIRPTQRRCWRFAANEAANGSSRDSTCWRPTYAKQLRPRSRR